MPEVIEIEINPWVFETASTNNSEKNKTFSSMSGAFAYDMEYLEKPILEATVKMITAAGMYLFLVFRHKDLPISFRALFLILFFALIMRFSPIGSTPILEDDHSRYLWDGGSRDGTLGKAAAYDINMIEGPKGRGLQVTEGTKRAKGGTQSSYCMPTVSWTGVLSAGFSPP